MDTHPDRYDAIHAAEPTEQNGVETLSTRADRSRTRPLRNYLMLPFGRPGSRWSARSPVVCLTLVTIPVVVFAVTAYFGSLSRLAEMMFHEKARAISKALDSAVNRRAASVAGTTAGRDRNYMLAPGRLHRIVEANRKKYPDLVSIQVISDLGETLAWAGDIPISDSGIMTDPVPLESLTQGHQDSASGCLIRDDPMRDVIVITREEKTGTGITWFFQAKFSKEFTQDILSLESPGTETQAELISLNRGWGQTAGQSSDSSVPTSSGSSSAGAESIEVSGNRLKGNIRAEALLPHMGWKVVLEGNPTGGLPWMPLVWTGLAVILSALAIILTTEAPTTPPDESRAADAFEPPLGPIDPANDGDDAELTETVEPESGEDIFAEPVDTASENLVYQDDAEHDSDSPPPPVPDNVFEEPLELQEDRLDAVSAAAAHEFDNEPEWVTDLLASIKEDARRNDEEDAPTDVASRLIVDETLPDVLEVSWSEVEPTDKPGDALSTTEGSGHRSRSKFIGT